MRLSKQAYSEIEKGNFSKAIYLFDQVLAKEMNTTILQDKGYCLNELKRYNEAICCFDRVIDIENNKNSVNYINAWYNKARALVGLNKPKEALTCLDILLSINPNHTNAQLLKNMLLKHTGNESQTSTGKKTKKYGNIYIHILFILIALFIWYPAFILNIIYLIYSYATS